ncbi:MAG: RidA family protein [Acidobacteriota bacterium]|nr:RidA family protein [Acidobacteriota bacterium]
MTDSNTVQSRLSALGITLPPLPAKGGNYVPFKIVGNMLYLSGVVSLDANGFITGTAGVDSDVEKGYAAARACALTQLAVIQSALGSLDRVAEVVSVNGYVNAAPNFPDAPAIINGASDLFVEVLGEAGRHVRAAIGLGALPRNALVEVQMTVRIKEA